MKYLRVHAEGSYEEGTIYERLDDDREYSEDDLISMGEDLVTNLFTWGVAVVDESEVPEGER